MVPGLPNSPTIAHSVYKYGYKTTYNSMSPNRPLKVSGKERALLHTRE